MTGITETHLTLQMRPEYCHGADDERASVPLEDVCEQLRLCHAMCYYIVQGRTVRDRHIVLLDSAAIDHTRVRRWWGSQHRRSCLPPPTLS